MFNPIEIPYRFLEKPHVFTRIEELVTFRGHRENRATNLRTKLGKEYSWVNTHTLGTIDSWIHGLRGKSAHAKYEIMARRLDRNRFPSLTRRH